MFAHALTPGGPRLTEGLPPTLQPNAILMAAPPADRMISGLCACLVYAALGSTAVLLARTQVRLGHPVGPTVAVVLKDDFTPAPPRLPAPPVQRVGNGARPADAAVTPVPVRVDQVPDVTPTSLSSTDHSHDGQFTRDMPIDPHGTGLVQQSLPVAHDSAPVMAPVEVDFSQMRVTHQVSPNYPPLARLGHFQGPVQLMMSVDAQGVPTEVHALSGPHPLLINEAIRVANQWRFEPARVNGQAVPAQFRLTVLFRLGS